MVTHSKMRWNRYVTAFVSEQGKISVVFFCSVTFSNLSCVHKLTYVSLSLHRKPMERKDMSVKATTLE